MKEQCDEERITSTMSNQTPLAAYEAAIDAAAQAKADLFASFGVDFADGHGEYVSPRDGEAYVADVDDYTDYRWRIDRHGHDSLIVSIGDGEEWTRGFVDSNRYDDGEGLVAFVVSDGDAVLVILSADKEVSS